MGGRIIRNSKPKSPRGMTQRPFEQLMRSLDQFTANQEQTTREVTKLQEIEQSIRSKNSQPSPRPVSASASTLKPVSRPASASKPVSPEPTRP
jgi:hypothetical protein